MHWEDLMSQSAAPCLKWNDFVLSLAIRISEQKKAVFKAAVDHLYGLPCL